MDRDFGLKQATENDPRITRIGRILRAMGLDELPQLLSIFSEEVSFAGPRSLTIGAGNMDISLRKVRISKGI